MKKFIHKIQLPDRMLLRAGKGEGLRGDWNFKIVNHLLKTIKA